MASACVNNIGMSPENFPATTYHSYGWLSPRISFSRELPDDDSSKASVPAAGLKPSPPSNEKAPIPPNNADPEPSACGDFEFRLEDPVAMLPADELFSDGKLVPLQLSAVKPSANALISAEISSPDAAKSRRRSEICGTDPYLFSPKAPRCSSRWKELLGLKKLTASSSNGKNESTKAASSSSGQNTKSLKHFLHRSSKSPSSSSDASLSLPLLKETTSSSDCESVSISSRLSLSSSSSGHDHEDLPRLSLDSDKPSPSLNLMISPNPNPFVKNPHPRIRMVKPRSGADNATATARAGRSPIRRADSSAVPTRGVSVDSPRMNSSGKIVFQSLERSSSSPSSFNGGPRLKHRGMERSYSANVRVTPVLNVPVCSLRGSSKSGSVFGFGQLFSSQQKKEGSGGNGNGSSGASNRGHHVHHHQQQQQQSNSRNRTDRT